MNLLDRYILTRLQRRPLTRLTRLLYWLRCRNLCWHLTETGRVVRVSRYGQAILNARPAAYYPLSEEARGERVVRLDVSLDTGVEQARGRDYYRKGKGQSMNTALYEMLTGTGTLLLFTLAVYRLLNPFRCKCGCWTWRAHKMLHHIEARHVHTHTGDE